MSFYSISSKIDGFENPGLKIDGFGRSHRTHADEAPTALAPPLIKRRSETNLRIFGAKTRADTPNSIIKPHFCVPLPP